MGLRLMPCHRFKGPWWECFGFDFFSVSAMGWVWDQKRRSKTSFLPSTWLYNDTIFSIGCVQLPVLPSLMDK
jgi:hypothetical protein